MFSPSFKTHFSKKDYFGGTTKLGMREYGKRLYWGVGGEIVQFLLGF